MKTVTYVLGLVTTALLLSGCGEDASSSSPSPELLEGKGYVETICIACHGQGLNGAPIIGNIKMWGPRIIQGEDTLVSHAINGYELMPAKGGSDLTDDQIRLAVRYMLSQLPEQK